MTEYQYTLERQEGSNKDPQNIISRRGNHYLVRESMGTASSNKTLLPAARNFAQVLINNSDLEAQMEIFDLRKIVISIDLK